MRTYWLYFLIPFVIADYYYECAFFELDNNQDVYDKKTLKPFLLTHLLCSGMVNAVELYAFHTGQYTYIESLFYIYFYNQYKKVV